MREKEESYYIRALKNGSYAAFETLYGMYSARLYGYCYRYTKSHEDTQDIMQDVFTSLWLSRGQIRDENSIVHYLFHIAKNKLINRFQSQVNSPVFEEYVAYCNSQDISVNNTGETVEYDDFRRAINQIKEMLPDTQKKVYEYSKEQELSNKEIAEILGLSEQTVKNQLSLALKIFREKLKEYRFISLLIGILLWLKNVY